MPQGQVCNLKDTPRAAVHDASGPGRPDYSRPPQTTPTHRRRAATHSGALGRVPVDRRAGAPGRDEQSGLSPALQGRDLAFSAPIRKGASAQRGSQTHRARREREHGCIPGRILQSVAVQSGVPSPVPPDAARMAAHGGPSGTCGHDCITSGHLSRSFRCLSGGEQISPQITAQGATFSVGTEKGQRHGRRCE